MKYINKPVFLLSVFAVTMAQPLFAAPLIEPYIGTGLSFDDNVVFSSENQKDDFGVDLLAGFVFSNNTEVMAATIEPMIRVYESFSESVFNEISPSLTINSVSKSERTTLNFLLKVQRDSTRTSELLTTADSTATGIAVQGKNRLFITAKPQWLYRLTPNSNISLNFTFSEADYNNGEEVGLYDYDNQALGLKYTQSVTERMELWAGPSYRRYTSFQRDSAATTSGFDVGVSGYISQRMQSIVEVGWSSSENRLASEKSTIDTVTANSSLNYKWDHGKATLIFQHDLSPSSIGELYKTNRLASDIETQINSRFSLGVAASYSEIEIARLTADKIRNQQAYIKQTIRFKLANNSDLEFSIRFDSYNSEGVVKDRLQGGFSYQYRPAGRYF